MLRPKFVATLLLAALVTLAVSLSPTFSIAQTSSAGDSKPASPQVATPSRDKALKYHKALQRRPNPGYLFDRFFNAWLDSSTTDELESFLSDQVKQSAKTSDRLLLAFFYATVPNRS